VKAIAGKDIQSADTLVVKLVVVRRSENRACHRSGSSKCGLALVSLDRVLHKTIVSAKAYYRQLPTFPLIFDDVIVVGNGTGSSRLIDALKSAISIPIEQ